MNICEAQTKIAKIVSDYNVPSDETLYDTKNQRNVLKMFENIQRLVNDDPICEVCDGCYQQDSCAHDELQNGDMSSPDLIKVLRTAAAYNFDDLSKGALTTKPEFGMYEDAVAIRMILIAAAERIESLNIKKIID